MPVCKGCNQIIGGNEKKIQCPNCHRWYHMQASCLDARHKEYNDYYRCDYCGSERREFWMRFCPHCGTKLYEFCPNCMDKFGYSKGCFISTAVYGSSLSHELNLLRDFRDNTLLKNSFLAWTVRLYYRISPSIAKSLEKDEYNKRRLRRIIDTSIALIKKRNNTSNVYCRSLYSSLAFLVYMYVLAYAKSVTRKEVNKR